ncbi:MAG: uracil phosphoribosyltransferase [Myxococcota bacterium]
MPVTVVDHPLSQHKLTLMRSKETPTVVFRQLLREIGAILCCEATRSLPVTSREIETPLRSMQSPVLDGKKLVFASIMRAGNGLLEGMLDLVPSARVAHVGLFRDPETLQPVEYYFKAPQNLEHRRVIVVDPMLATGNSAAAAVQRVKDQGAKDVQFVCLLAAPPGIERLERAAPEVSIVTAAVDPHLDEHGYIVPGLGDAGDRMYGTR